MKVDVRFVFIIAFAIGPHVDLIHAITHAHALHRDPSLGAYRE